MTRTSSLPDAATLAAYGRTVIEREAEALTILAGGLDGAFSDIVRTLEAALARGGRILVTGLGKSGIAARKVASTLCSTGAPAVFVHAAEAAHGELGLVTGNDVLLALSRSGDIESLGPIVSAAQRLDAPIVAWTAVPESALAREADVTMVFDVGPEADPDDLIPSTSSTAMIAFGDAVAIALYRGRGLRAEDFAKLHPGGTLGRRLTLRVRDLMHEDLPLVRPGDTLLDVLQVISTKRLGVAIVAEDGGRVVGVLTDGDVRRSLLENDEILREPVEKRMTRDPRTIGPDELVARALQRMEDPARRITALVVVDGSGRAVGVLHLHDCLEAGLR